MSNIVKRSEKIPFYGVQTEDGIKYVRMTGFTEISVSKNPSEHKRQYIDEDFERNDVVGYTPSIAFSFDMFKDNPVHEDMVSVFNCESTGETAVKSIVMVDLSKELSEGTFSAVKRNFTLIPDKEGSSEYAYTYSGNFNVAGEKTFGSATSQDNWESCQFNENV